MSEDDGRTEPATAKKRSEERKKGNVCKTPELSPALILLMSFIVLNSYGNKVFESLKGYMFQTFNNLPFKAFSFEYLNEVATNTMLVFAKATAPFLLVIVFIGIVANIAQVKWLVSFKYLENWAQKFNVLQGVKKMFISVNFFISLAKDLFKVSVVMLVGYSLIKNNLLSIILFTGADPAVVMDQLGKFIYQFGSRAAFALLFIAFADYLIKKKQFEKSIMMTKQEIKDEFKSQEGDPMIKSAIRGKQRAMARKRMMQAVPTADVVITNPTTYAVALKYGSDSDAPVVVAKGIRLVAEKIKEIAIENGIPVVENVFVAQTLYWQVEIGQKIPPFLYYAVAEILAYVYKMKNNFAMGN
jgi:flagellar biosynthetic protein FlhB